MSKSFTLFGIFCYHPTRYITQLDNGNMSIMLVQTSSIGPRQSTMKMKWGDSKWDVAKFCGVHQVVRDLKESSRTSNNLIIQTLELYRQKMGKIFTFKHCWLLLRIWMHFATFFQPMGNVTNLPLVCHQLPQ